MKRLLYKSSISVVILMLFAFALQTKAQTNYDITLIQPTEAGIEIEIGQDYMISWTDNLSTPVKIMFYDGGPGTFEVLTGASSVDGSTWIWDTDGLSTATGCKIKVVSTVDSDINDVTENPFALVYDANAEITVLQPSLPNISWVRGTSHLISWTDNLSGTVSLELLDSGGNTALNIATGVEGSTYSWPIPGALTEGNYRMKVISDDNPDEFAVGDNLFAITETGVQDITLIQPDGGEEWALNTEHLITWMDNFEDGVDIDLIDVTGPTTTGIADDVAGSSYAWTINDLVPVSTGENYKIRIYKHGSPGVYDESEEIFEITATADGFIEVLQPDGGEEWLKGTQHLLSWTDNLLGTVSIDLLDNGSAVTTIASGVEGSTYTWTVPTSLGGSEYQVRVTSDEDGAITNSSDEDFSIVETLPGAITVLQPDVSGIQWQRGTTKLISWIDSFTAENVDITLFKGDDEVLSIATDVEGSTYSWPIPESLVYGSNYSIVVSGHITTGTSDESNNDFTITVGSPGGEVTVIQPNGGEEWLLDGTYVISWTDNLTENVNIDLIGGPNTVEIEHNVEGSTYSWYIDSEDFDAGTNYKVVVSSSVGSASDESNAPFSIVESLGGEITVIQPNGGEHWEQNSEHVISWTDNVSENVNIDLIDYGTPGTTIPIATNVEGSTYTWFIDEFVYPIGGDYRVKVYTVNAEDESNSTFNIDPEMQMSVHPNPVNQNLTVGMEGLDAGYYQLILYNQFNIPVKTTSVNTTGKQEMIIRTSDLPNGIYFLMLKSQNKVYSEKIIVQH